MFTLNQAEPEPENGAHGKVFLLSKIISSFESFSCLILLLSAGAASLSIISQGFISYAHVGSKQDLHFSNIAIAKVAIHTNTESPP